MSIARCGNIFGGGDRNWSRLIPGTIRSLLQQERPLIRSDWQFIRDYLYVADAVTAYLLLAEKTESVAGEAFNFAPSQPHTVLEVVGTIQKLMGTELSPKILNQARAEIRDQFLTSQKAARLLGWSSQYSLEEALEETILWYRSYLSKGVYALA